jgi:hypothetical protein
MVKWVQENAEEWICLHLRHTKINQHWVSSKLTVLLLISEIVSSGGYGGLRNYAIAGSVITPWAYSVLSTHPPNNFRFSFALILGEVLLRMNRSIGQGTIFLAHLLDNSKRQSMVCAHFVWIAMKNKRMWSHFQRNVVSHEQKSGDLPNFEILLGFYINDKIDKLDSNYGLLA